MTVCAASAFQCEGTSCFYKLRVNAIAPGSLRRVQGLGVEGPGL